MADCWAGYNGINSDPNRDLIVEKVNHSKNFRDPVTSACTNTIEGKQSRYSSLFIHRTNQTLLGTWNGIKMHVPYRHRTGRSMPWKLVEFIWRRKHSGNYWGALMKNLSEVSFTPSGDTVIYFD